MNKQMFWSGIIMQIANLSVLAILFLEWNIRFILMVLLGSVYALYNIASIIFIIIGLVNRR